MRSLLAIIVIVTFVVSQTTLSYAVDSKSANYGLLEPSFGDGGLNNSTSASFQARDAVGDVAIGNSASASFQIKAGSKTTPDPTLGFSTSGTGVSFGSFSSNTPSTSTTTFSVSDYTSYGYVVQVFGAPPSNGAHTLTAMATTASSTPGTEQFGINLVANTAPVSFGANLNNGGYGFGTVSANYGTANVFRYVQGETIAAGPKSSGVTIYTISYLVNVAGLTPGGQYTSNQTLVVTGTY
jgi:hypothetical protein